MLVLTEDCFGTAGTVWLYGDRVNHPGLLGFLTSARKEYKGDRVRAVVSSKPVADYTQLIQSSRRLDLLINFFDHGRNGYYAPVQTKVFTYPYRRAKARDSLGCCQHMCALGSLHLLTSASIKILLLYIGCAVEPSRISWNEKQSKALQTASCT